MNSDRPSFATIAIRLLAGGVALSLAGFAISVRADEPAVKAPKLPKVVSLSAQPAALVLDDSRDVRSLLVTGQTVAGYGVDLSKIARLQPASGIVRVADDGSIVPVKAGKTTLLVSAQGKTTTVPVTVKSVASPPVSFVREIMPILSKSGCNAGTCHGSAKGKNGFKLSLRGYDPEYDYHALVSDVEGRRFNRTDPSQSLMLLKPTMAVPHKGFMAILPNSRAYWLLSRWLTEGAVYDGKTVKRASRLELLPAVPNVTLPGMTQKTLVLAHYPDGTTRDVSRDAVFTSSMPEVATTTPAGIIAAARRGEAALLVRYEGNYATNGITVLGDRTGYRWSNPPEYSYVDKWIDRKLQKIKALPSGLCDDATFLRRVSIDLTGLPPTPEQTRAFLADKTPTQQKRARLTDGLLNSPDYVERWTNKWADLLSANSRFLGERGVLKFRNWIRNAVTTNMPYDQFVRALVTASGDAYENPAVNYLRVAREPGPATENVTQLFLGVRFSCNKCHDHPFERWTQKQYYQMGAYFAQVGYKGSTEPGDEVVYNTATGENIYPRTQMAIAPSVPVGHAKLASNEPDRRQVLAAWLTSVDNPFFSRAMVNRLWSYFLGRGIIDPVDDIRGSNPACNPELLEALNSDFVSHGFDLKHMMRVIVTSRTYQQSIATNRWNADDKTNFSHAFPRRLEAEQLLDAINLATGTISRFGQLPMGARAKQVPDAAVNVEDAELLDMPEDKLTPEQKTRLASVRSASQAATFLNLFGKPARETPCECERSSSVSLGQALSLINGPTISDAVAAPNGRLTQLLKTNPSDEKLVEDVFLSTLCRMPTAKERQAALANFKASANRAEGAQDLMWALINSPAFLFNR